MATGLKTVGPVLVMRFAISSWAGTVSIAIRRHRIVAWTVAGGAEVAREPSSQASTTTRPVNNSVIKVPKNNLCLSIVASV